MDSPSIVCLHSRYQRVVWAGLVFLHGLLSAFTLSLQAQALPQPDHIVIVIAENQAYSALLENPEAAYINALASQGALFTNSFALTHPSQPNYLGFFAGDTFGVGNECLDPFAAPNLGTALIDAGFTFIGYSESQPRVGYRVCDESADYPYAKRHNPWASLRNVPEDSNRPFTDFPSDYSNLPTVAIVVPNMLNNMHDGSIAEGDAWLQTHLDAYVQWAQANNSLLIVTWDEDDGSEGNRIVTLFIGPMVQPGQYDEAVDHYRVLRTIEDMYGLPAVGESANRTPIADVWQ
jgi:phosphatidylinositol-3-phosphatase